MDSVYFGGGTPSLMTPSLVGAILDRVATTWSLSNQIEITLEANPGSVEAAKFTAFRDAGVNRVSLGVQALNDDDLRRLGRMHSVREARKALEIAQSTFDRASFDLIYARQWQSLNAWQDELSQALGFGADHMSLYQLTVEDGTVFGKRYQQGGLRGLPEEDLSADMYELTQDMTSAAGMPAYEVSNHALAGSESRHNLIYWQGGDYAGVGPGAHGRVTLNGVRHATETALSPSDWLRRVFETGSGETTVEALNGYDRAVEYLMMGLRVSGGIELERLRSMSDRVLNEAALDQLIRDGLINRNETALWLTDSGRPVLNAILRNLLA